jgi:dTMP kinase
MRGHLVVIDGADGSGKATQSRRLVERLGADGHAVEHLDFPRYTDNHFGQLIRECLDGARGDFMALDPRIASVLYAADRYESRERIESWLAAGKIVVLDRYVSANMMHQGAKVRSQAELDDFLRWLDHMEHGVFGLPRPTAIFYLEVPYDVRRVLIQNDATRQTVDTAEINHDHQRTCEERAQQLVASQNAWHLIQCVEGTTLRSKDDIHEEIYERVRTLLAL